jgi:hypothetical protein
MRFDAFIIVALEFKLVNIKKYKKIRIILESQMKKEAPRGGAS